MVQHLKLTCRCQDPNLQPSPTRWAFPPQLILSLQAFGTAFYFSISKWSQSTHLLLTRPLENMDEIKIWEKEAGRGWRKLTVSFLSALTPSESLTEHIYKAIENWW